MEETLAEIARRHLNVPTLVTRNSDSLDFHECAVWALKDALAPTSPEKHTLEARHHRPTLSEPAKDDVMALKAPFRFPVGFLAAFGYRRGRRFVALFWEPCGDEACYDDGESYACGMCDKWMYLDFVRQPEVRQWLDGNDINLGNSDEAATHWLVVDAGTGEAHAAPCREARSALLDQRMPG